MRAGRHLVAHRPRRVEVAVIRPDPARVERIMQETGMDRLQAHRHEVQRLGLVARFDEARRVAAARAVDRLMAANRGEVKA